MNLLQPVAAQAGTIHGGIATVYDPVATVHAAAVTVQFRLAEAPGPGCAESVFIATACAGTVGIATGGGKAPILKETVRTGTGVVAESGGTVRGSG